MFAVPILLLGLLAPDVVAPPDPAYASLEAGYRALRERKYGLAIRKLEEAAELAPNRSSIRKDLGYAYLKVGETELARDSFAVAAELDPMDEHVALEYAFLCYETKQQATARRVFDRIRRSGNAVAEQAFHNIDSELVAGISRWSRAIELAGENFSAHQELARLAEQRDDLALAALHFESAWRLRPDLPEFLVDLGRVWKLQGDVEKGHAALLAASRGAQPRAAEAATELLPRRYPYVYEFEAALRIDPNNVALRRELAYLHLEMGSKAEAEREFREVIRRDPSDLLSTAQLGFLLLNRNERDGALPLLDKVLGSNDEQLADRVREALHLPRLLRRSPEQSRRKTSIESKELAEKSLQAGYLKDALRYLRVAHENDPIDFDVMLKLGWVHNILKDDRSA
ncbi:MAG TPA: tetratricopeptide repeat protein, partial [Bryobacteraceae bacterium]|nr:tetratricopeptide repeat protein [Bryobacteraceae bacterium]